MPKTTAKASAKRGRSSGRKTVAGTRPRGSTSKNTRQSVASEHRYIVENGRPTHVIVPVHEYERLVKAEMIRSGVAKLKDEETEWVDADALGWKLAGERIAQARKAEGLTQKQLGERLNIPQSQISRIERNPDHTTLKTLKRVARALGVDVRALI